MKDWPPSVALKGVFLQALSGSPDGLTTRDIHKIARDHIPGGFKPNPYTGTNAVRALVGAGCMVEHPTKPDHWIIASPRDAMGNRAFTEAEIVAACAALGVDKRRFLTALFSPATAPAAQPLPEPQPEPAPIIAPRPAPFAGTPAEAIAAARSILRDNEAQALTIGEWSDLAEAEGIILSALARDHRPALFAGISTVTREDDCTGYWMPRNPQPPPPPDADTEDDDGSLPVDV